MKYETKRKIVLASSLAVALLIIVGMVMGVDYALDYLGKKLDKRTAMAEAAKIHDTAIVLGQPVDHVTNSSGATAMVYPVFLKKVEIHAWLMAVDIRRHLSVGDEVEVRYDEKHIRTSIYSTPTVEPASPESSGEAKIKLDK